MIKSYPSIFRDAAPAHGTPAGSRDVSWRARAIARTTTFRIDERHDDERRRCSPVQRPASFCSASSRIRCTFGLGATTHLRHLGGEGGACMHKSIRTGPGYNQCDSCRNVSDPANPSVCCQIATIATTHTRLAEKLGAMILVAPKMGCANCDDNNVVAISHRKSMEPTIYAVVARRRCRAPRPTKATKAEHIVFAIRCGRMWLHGFLHVCVSPLPRAPVS